MAAIILAVARSATAQDDDAGTARLYDVELVVFENLDAAAHASPEADTEPPFAPPAAAVETPAADTALAGTPAADLSPAPAPGSVTDTGNVIELPSNRFQLNGIEGALRRSAGYRPLAHFGWSQPATARGASEFVPLDDRLAVPALAGNARLAAGRFLHLSLDIEWTGEDGAVHRIETTRRMKSGERHYFDDPWFGVIAVVTRRDDAG
jgi:Peptidoglycan-binding protein, CsiV